MARTGSATSLAVNRQPTAATSSIKRPATGEGIIYILAELPKKQDCSSNHAAPPKQRLSIGYQRWANARFLCLQLLLVSCARTAVHTHTVDVGKQNILRCSSSSSVNESAHIQSGEYMCMYLHTLPKNDPVSLVSQRVVYYRGLSNYLYYLGVPYSNYSLIYSKTLF